MLGVEIARVCSGLGQRETGRPVCGGWGVMSSLEPIKRKKWEKGREKRDRPVIFQFLPVSKSFSFHNASMEYNIY